MLKRFCAVLALLLWSGLASTEAVAAVRCGWDPCSRCVRHGYDYYGRRVCLLCMRNRARVARCRGCGAVSLDRGEDGRIGRRSLMRSGRDSHSRPRSPSARQAIHSFPRALQTFNALGVALPAAFTR